MRSLSDLNLNGAEAAELAQFLRGVGVFGSVAFSENASFVGEDVLVETGYADCLPILGGGCWRDPASPDVVETIK